jgi:hypothetical protein
LARSGEYFSGSRPRSSAMCVLRMEGLRTLFALRLGAGNPFVYYLQAFPKDTLLELD